MFDRISFILGEAMSAMRRNGFMTFAAISTVAVSLFLLGGAGYAYYRAVQYADTIPGKFEMRVFLKDGTSYSEITRTAERIRGIEGVKTVNWMPRDKVWAKMMREEPEKTRGLTMADNPLPDSYKVTIRDLGLGDRIASSIEAMPAVQQGGVQYLKNEQELVNNGIRVLRWLGTSVGGLLLLTAGVLIFNAIRLAVLSRRLEIRITRLVGASPATVFVPFLIEGAVQGLLGGALAAAMLIGANTQLGIYLQSLDAQALLPPFPTVPALIILGGLGAAYGIFCSALSLRTRHEVQ